MNIRKFIPLIVVFLLTACANTNSSETAFSDVQTDASENVTTASDVAETQPVTIKINENASLSEQIVDVLLFLISTEGNALYNDCYSSISLADVNFDDIPEIIIFDNAGTAADYAYFYSLNGSELGAYGIPSMMTSYDCVEKDGRKLFMVTGKCLDHNPSNGEEGPTDYHIIMLFDFDKNEEHIYSSTVIYEDDSLENIISSSVRIDDIKITDTATADEIELYYNEFMSGLSVIGPVEQIFLDISSSDLPSRDNIIDKINPQVNIFETQGDE